MAISYSVLQELKRELSDLERARTGIEARINALKLILRSHPIKTAAKKRAKYARGLKAKLRTLVRETPGLQLGSILKALEEAGFSLSGKTPLRERVNRELRRMVHRNLLRRDKSGGFSIVDVLEPQERQGMDLTASLEAVG